eukprot:s1454_g4.t1
MVYDLIALSPLLQQRLAAPALPVELPVVLPGLATLLPSDHQLFFCSAPLWLCLLAVPPLAKAKPRWEDGRLPPPASNTIWSTHAHTPVFKQPGRHSAPWLMLVSFACAPASSKIPMPSKNFTARAIALQTPFNVFSFRDASWQYAGLSVINGFVTCVLPPYPGMPRPRLS